MLDKKQRIMALIQKNISDIILFEMKHDVMRLVTVTSVDVSNDLSYAKVYVACLDPKKNGEMIERLTKARGFIRTELAKRMDIRKVPELNFVKDDTYDKGQRIEEILSEIKKEEK